MPFGLLADLLLLLHGGFVIFVVGGGLLVLRWPRVAWLHLPATLWGAVIEFAGFVCPLTPLEQAWRRAAGGQAYEGGFIEHYVTAALYPGGLTRPLQVALGLIVLAVNGWVYWRVWRHRKSGRPDPLMRPTSAGGAGPAVFSFRPLTPSDLPLLHEWLARPHVAEWWGPAPAFSEVQQEFGPLTTDQSTTRPYVVLGDGVPIGYIQSYVATGSGDGWWLDEHDPGVRGIDQFLAHSEQLGRGLGTAMVRAFVRHLFADPAVTRIQTDPSPGNGRAIRCYDKAGFHRVGEIDTPDGRALLMVCDRAESARL